jgi:hypothetical protein
MLKYKCILFYKVIIYVFIVESNWKKFPPARDIYMVNIYSMT